MLIADSHEFLEMYRGDKDLRIGMEMAKLRGDVRFVSFAPDRTSPIDRARFGVSYMRELELPDLPEGMELRLLPSISLRFARKESGGIVSVMPRLRSEIVRLRPDVIFENPFSWLTPRSYQTHSAARVLGVPIVYYDPGDDIPISTKHRVMAHWERPVVNDASAIITFNEAGRSRFMNKYGYPSSRLHVIPKPIDVRLFERGADVEALRSAKGFDSDTFVVGYLGRLARYKGSAYLLEVAQRALSDENMARCRFLFIGGAFVADTNEESYHLPNTVLTGMLAHHEVASYLSMCDVVVFPDLSSPGGFSTAIAEAMAAGKTLVVGVGDRHDFVPLVHEETAILVPPRDPGAIAEALTRLMMDPALAHRLGARVGKFAREHMDYPRVASEYLRLLDSVVHEAQANRSINSARK